MMIRGLDCPPDLTNAREERENAAWERLRLCGSGQDRSRAKRAIILFEFLFDFLPTAGIAGRVQSEPTMTPEIADETVAALARRGGRRVWFEHSLG
jgi:hypothetical protein